MTNEPLGPHSANDQRDPPPDYGALVAFTASACGTLIAYRTKPERTDLLQDTI
jgi:hypothetical protein